MSRRWLLPVVVLITLSTSAAACSDPGGDRPSAPDTSTSTAELEQMSDEELAAEAYVAALPLVVSIRTMQRLGGLLGTNNLFWQSSLSGPDNRLIVAPNRDTLYSVAVLDLRAEPLVLTLPEVTDRYYTYQLLSAWTESFAYIGTRATGGEAGRWLITAPGWEGDRPPGAEVIEAPTPQVFLLGRFLVDDEADIANVLRIRDRSSLVPLSELTGDAPGPSTPELGEPVGSPQDIPTDASFFDELAPALAVNPPPTSHQRELLTAAEDRLDIEGAQGDQRAVLAAGAAAGGARIEQGIVDGSEVVDGWTVHRDIGTYGDDLVRRAVVARVGWGANVPEEAVYPLARIDAEGEPLDGSGGRAYTLTFGADELPPIEDLGFWSLSAYGADMFFVPHPSGRYTVGDRTPGLTLDDDGSLTVTLSHEAPAAPAGNWLPVPDGPFVLMLRLYLPAAPVLDGVWTPPAVVPVAR